jgi:octaprenyl-diphosphate synthase
LKNLKLSDITLPINDDLSKFNDHFKESLKSKVPLVDLVTKYILKQKGKKIRPTLVLLSAKASGGINESTFRGATLVELLHTATLVHDDVVDEAEKRRGLPSINAVWKNKVAVLIGDYLLSRGLMIAVEGGDFEFLRITTNTVKRMSEGELLQIGKTKKLDINEETYYRIISDKTASLLSTCCEIGALSASDNPEKRAAMRNYGEYLGIAFQIKDDILDYSGRTFVVGKPLGADIKEKKITLPLIHALKQADDSDSKRIIKLIRKGFKNGGEKEVIEFVNKHNGIEYSYEAANGFSRNAKDELKILPDSESKSALSNLVDYIISRNK